MTCRTPQPVVEILSRVAAELNDLAQSVDRLHSLIEGFDGEDMDREAFLQNAQAIDLIEQRLSSLSHFMIELIEIVPPEWEVIGRAAAQKLKLAALAHRLSAPEGHHVQVGHATGDLEMF
jgi:hypothetical protein